jgi:hypothetical protein
MAIIAFEHTLTPAKIPTCKRTYVVAKGRATATAATAGDAVDQAKAGAREELALAIADARALICPQTCRRGICRDGGLRLQGFGLNWTRPVKNPVTKRWRSTATARRSFDKVCRCRG